MGCQPETESCPQLYTTQVCGTQSSDCIICRPGFKVPCESLQDCCGDGELDVETGETCDPPGAVLPNGAICRADCTFCGDGVVDVNETCDDGNIFEYDTCTSQCEPFECPVLQDNIPGACCEPGVDCFHCQCEWCNGTWFGPNSTCESINGTCDECTTHANCSLIEPNQDGQCMSQEACEAAGGTVNLGVGSVGCSPFSNLCSCCTGIPVPTPTPAPNTSFVASVITVLTSFIAPTATPTQATSQATSLPVPPTPSQLVFTPLPRPTPTPTPAPPEECCITPDLQCSAMGGLCLLLEECVEPQIYVPHLCGRENATCGCCFDPMTSDTDCPDVSCNARALQDGGLFGTCVTGLADPANYTFFCERKNLVGLGDIIEEEGLCGPYDPFPQNPCGCQICALPDRDGDNVTDQNDNCPDDSNSLQTDTDADGLGNPCDNCPFDFNPDQADADSDGVGDVCDNCPNDFNPDQNEVPCATDSSVVPTPTPANPCGNGVLEQGEECDDGNNANGDGCNSLCQVESGWECIEVSPSVCSRIELCVFVIDNDSCSSSATWSMSLTAGVDCVGPISCQGVDTYISSPAGTIWGINPNGASCMNTLAVRALSDCYNCSTAQSSSSVTVMGGPCPTPVCQNGIREDGEECDDGNAVDNDGCRNNCTLPFQIVDIAEVTASSDSAATPTAAPPTSTTTAPSEDGISDGVLAGVVVLLALAALAILLFVLCFGYCSGGSSSSVASGESIIPSKSGYRPVNTLADYAEEEYYEKRD